MAYMDLLERICANDREAFLEMTDRYGWAVYSAIRKKYPDPATADRVYNETMNSFYHSLSDSDGEDLLEALLCAYAARVSPDETEFSYDSGEDNDGIPQIALCSNVAAKNPVTGEKKRNPFWKLIGVLSLLVLVAAAVWTIAGVLMEKNLIPYWDLGYSWFNSHFINLF